MEYKAIIFDMDGTIVDTEKIWASANRILIERRGIKVTPDLSAQITSKIGGLAIHKSCAIIKEMVGLTDPIDDIIREKSKIALDLYEKGISFIEGFQEFHQAVIDPLYSLKTAIATNADEATIAITNRTLSLDRFFGKHIYGISRVQFICKPDPAIYLHVAGQLGVRPEECIAIEDSAHGINAAKAAGMYCIGINTSRSFEQVKNADRIIDHYHELDIKKLRL